MATEKEKIKFGLSVETLRELSITYVSSLKSDVVVETGKEVNFLHSTVWGSEIDPFYIHKRDQFRFPILYGKKVD